MWAAMLSTKWWHDGLGGMWVDSKGEGDCGLGFVVVENSSELVVMQVS